MYSIAEFVTFQVRQIKKRYLTWRLSQNFNELDGITRQLVKGSALPNSQRVGMGLEIRREQLLKKRKNILKSIQSMGKI